MQKTTAFLMFEGKAEEAINFYTSLFANSEIIHILRYEANQGGVEGKVLHAKFVLNGTEYMAIDSSIKHAFTFTPAFSIYVSCESIEEVDRLYASLSEAGQVLMPLDAYPFSEKYAWVTDRFGVSWQIGRS